MNENLKELKTLMNIRKIALAIATKEDIEKINSWIFEELDKLLY